MALFAQFHTHSLSGNLIVRFWSILISSLCVLVLIRLVHMEMLDKSIFWDSEVEKEFEKLKKPFVDIEINNLTITKLSSGCGKPLNQKAILSNGKIVCFRYRPNLEQIQGEMFTYYLGRVLGIRNLVSTKLERISYTIPLWKRSTKLLQNRSWEEGHLVIITTFEENAKPVHIPKILLHANFSMDRHQLQVLHNKQQESVDLLQWSELMVFDYLIGNFDRVVSNMYNQQWYEQSLEEPINNLIKSTQGFWLFIDNEDGLLHGYRLIEKYEIYLRKMLGNFCIFRQDTVNSILKLLRKDATDVWMLIWKMFEEENHEYVRYLPKMPSRYRRILFSRLKTLAEHFEKCRRSLGQNTSPIERESQEP